MISHKMKQDAAKIQSEIKIIATRMPLLFHNYDYLNEDAKEVLKRRKEQLDEIKGVKAFLHENAAFTNALVNCEKDFININEELERLGVNIQLDDVHTNHSDEDGASKNTDSDDDESSGPIANERKIFTISRDNSFIPGTPAMKHLRK